MVIRINAAAAIVHRTVDRIGSALTRWIADRFPIGQFGSFLRFWCAHRMAA
jgi:hypothetical protein